MQDAAAGAGVARLLRALPHPPPAERCDARRPVVIVANHASHLDAPAVLAALPHRHASPHRDRRCRRLLLSPARARLRRQPGHRHLSVPTRGIVGLERAAELLDAGWNILIFPEGTRSSDGALHTFRHGVGRLVAESHAAVLPVGIVGAHALWPRTSKLPRRGPIEVTLGQTWQPPTTDSPAAICAELRRRVANLIGDRS